MKVSSSVKLLFSLKNNGGKSGRATRIGDALSPYALETPTLSFFSLTTGLIHFSNLSVFLPQPYLLRKMIYWFKDTSIKSTIIFSTTTFRNDDRIQTISSLGDMLDPRIPYLFVSQSQQMTYYTYH